jgi:hypothetical protein
VYIWEIIRQLRALGQLLLRVRSNNDVDLLVADLNAGKLLDAELDALNFPCAHTNDLF